MSDDTEKVEEKKENLHKSNISNSSDFYSEDKEKEIETEKENEIGIGDNNNNK